MDNLYAGGGDEDGDTGADVGDRDEEDEPMAGDRDAAVGGDGDEDGREPEGDGLTLLQRARRELRVDGNAFRHRLSRLRAQRGWSFRDMARESGVSVTTIRNIEIGQSLSPEPETARALAWALGFASAADMMGDTEAGRPADAPARAPKRQPAAVNLDRLVEQLLTGLWAAQREAVGGEPGRVSAIAAGGVVFFDPPGGGKGVPAPSPTTGPGPADG